MEKLNINEWAPEDRPREKLLAKGPQALSEAELLAILIGSGSTSESAVDLMRRILGDRGNSLKALGRMTLSELVAYKGVGEAKAVTIMAACELGKRRMREPANERMRMESSDDLYQQFRSYMMDLHVEECHLLALNAHNEVRGHVVVAQGGISSTTVDVRVVLKKAILLDAVSIAFCHNHPSGNPLPSRQDDDLTRRLLQACQAVNIHLLDHVVLGDGRYYSYHDAGKL